MAVTELPPCDEPGCTAQAEHRIIFGSKRFGVVRRIFVCRWHLDNVHMPRINEAHRLSTGG